MYFLWGQVGPSCLAGVVVISMMIPITKVVASWLGRIQKILMKARDDRVSLNNEVLGAMKIIKIQAWEEDFRAKLVQLRDQELSRLRHYFVTSAISITSYSSAPLLVAVSTFAAYTMAGNTLDVATALTALALFDIIRFPMFMFPQIINSLVEAGISCERVREFLLGEEVVGVGEGKLGEEGEVLMKNGTFVYGEDCVVTILLYVKTIISIDSIDSPIPLSLQIRRSPICQLVVEMWVLQETKAEYEA